MELWKFEVYTWHGILSALQMTHVTYKIMKFYILKQVKDYKGYAMPYSVL